MMENMMASEIDIDDMSISSEFSIIPDNLVYGSEENSPQKPISMNASFRKSNELIGSATSSGAANFVFNKVHFGTLQRVNDSAKCPQGPFIVMFCCDPDFKMTKLDRIAMYKVGFSSAKDDLCYVWVPVPGAKLDSLTDQSLSYKNTPVTVKFEGSCLPQDEEESYQVCYLTHDGLIAGVSVPFQLKMVESSEEEEIENSARHVLSIRVQGLVQEQRDLRDSIQDLEIVCNNLRCENEELMEKLKEHNKNIESSKAHSEELEKQVATLQSELDKVYAEAIEKDQQLKHLKLSLFEINSSYATARLRMKSLEESLETEEEERKVADERNKVIMQDYIELKTCLQHVKENLDQALKEKEAAEKIAIDLSLRLQTTHDDHEVLTKSNKILLDKLNGIQMEKSIEESLKSGGWHCVPKENEYEEKEEDEEAESYAPQSLNEEAKASAVMESVAPSMMESVCHSSCSQNTKELAEAFSQKMEVIVSQLTLQKEQINCLKVEIEKTRHESRSASVESQLTTTSEIITEEPTETINEDSNCANNEAQDVVEISSKTSLPVTLKAKTVKDVCSNTPDDDKKVLYGHSFLPTCCTAPVFFPYPVTKQPPRSVLPSAPSSTSMGINEDYSIITTDGLQQSNSVIHVEHTPSPTNLDNHSQTPSSAILDNHSLTPPQSNTILDNNIQNPSPQQPIVVASTSGNLPPPLLPETTATARNAAVLNQYIYESTLVNSFQSVESNSQASGNIRETAREQSSPTMLSCPMCHLSFEENGIHLLQEHIDSHLERVCPVCSTAFPRSTKQEEFEVHVQSHFRDEEGQSISSSDLSGPWGQQQNTNRSFQLLEID